MITAETTPRMGGEGIKENGEGMNSSMIYLMCCKNFCKFHNVPPPNTKKISNNFKDLNLKFIRKMRN
jgi:hypothetical protein